MRKKLTIRQRVRVYLAQADMTQGELAPRCDMSEARLSLVLNGKSTATLKEALCLADITGIPARDFAQQEVA